MRNILCALLVSALPLPVAAQASRGYEAKALVSALPIVTLSSGAFLSWNLNRIELRSGQGKFVRTVAAFGPTFSQGTSDIDPSERFLFVPDFAGAVVYRVELATDEVTAYAVPSNPEEVVFESDTSLVLMRTVDQVAEIYRLDLEAATAVLIATVPETVPLPVEVDGSGGLFFGLNQPPRGIYWWAAAQLTGSPIADLTNATLVGAGYGAPWDLALDHSNGELYVLDNTVAVWRFEGNRSESTRITTGRVYPPIGVQFVPGPGPARFEAFQPAGGGRLVVLEYTKFMLARTEVRPLRPSSSVEGVGTSGPGAFDLTIEDGPRNGSAIVFATPVAGYGPELALEFPGLSAPLFSGMSLGQAVVVASALLDNAGSARIMFQNPGVLQAVVFQPLLLDANLWPVQFTTASTL